MTCDTYHNILRWMRLAKTCVQPLSPLVMPCPPAEGRSSTVWGWWAGWCGGTWVPTPTQGSSRKIFTSGFLLWNYDFVFICFVWSGTLVNKSSTKGCSSRDCEVVNRFHSCTILQPVPASPWNGAETAQRWRGFCKCGNYRKLYLTCNVIIMFSKKLGGHALRKRPAILELLQEWLHKPHSRPWNSWISPGDQVCHSDTQHTAGYV